MKIFTKADLNLLMLTCDIVNYLSDSDDLLERVIEVRNELARKYGVKAVEQELSRIWRG